MISYLLDEVTAKKIQIFSSQEHWGPVLAQDIPLDQLPLEYGGTGSNNLGREYSLLSNHHGDLNAGTSAAAAAADYDAKEEVEEDDDDDGDEEGDGDVTEIVV
jgi:hypothetical protein